MIADGLERSKLQKNKKNKKKLFKKVVGWVAFWRLWGKFMNLQKKDKNALWKRARKGVLNWIISKPDHEQVHFDRLTTELFLQWQWLG